MLLFQCFIKITAAYGSTKDISVYSVLGLPASQIFIVGRPTKKYQTQCQVCEGQGKGLGQLLLIYLSLLSNALGQAPCWTHRRIQVAADAMASRGRENSNDLYSIAVPLQMTEWWGFGDEPQT